MQLDAKPPLGESETDALRVALEREEIGLLRAEELAQSAWRRAGLFEAVDRDADDGYAFSPRSTRGATRA